MAKGMPLRVGSLFSGVGGLDLGLERAGMEIAWQVEVDGWCREVLDAHWPGLRREADIAGVDFRRMPEVGVLAGGFPCQPVSVAGGQRAQKDDRWLWAEFERAVCQARPQYVLIENVEGLTSHGKNKRWHWTERPKSPLAEVVLGLAHIGYDSEWQVLPATEAGAAHERGRVYIVAYPRGEGLPRLCGQPEEEAGGPPPRIYLQRAYRQARQELARGRKEPQWEAEPDLDRMAHGVPAVVDCGRDARRPEGQDIPVGSARDRRWSQNVRRRAADAGWDDAMAARLSFGFPTPLDNARLHGLGDAVVPAMGELVGRLIVADWEHSRASVGRIGRLVDTRRAESR